jgi:hypothetical protein
LSLDYAIENKPPEVVNYKVRDAVAAVQMEDIGVA